MADIDDTQENASDAAVTLASLATPSTTGDKESAEMASALPTRVQPARTSKACQVDYSPALGKKRTAETTLKPTTTKKKKDHKKTEQQLQQAIAQKKARIAACEEKKKHVLENKMKRKHKKKKKKEANRPNLLLVKFNYNFFKFTATAFMIEDWLKTEHHKLALPETMQKNISHLEFCSNAEPWRKVGEALLKERYPDLLPKTTATDAIDDDKAKEKEQSNH